MSADPFALAFRRDPGAESNAFAAMAAYNAACYDAGTEGMGIGDLNRLMRSRGHSRRWYHRRTPDAHMVYVDLAINPNYTP